MNFHRLSWRIGLPFLLVVLVETATLVVLGTRQLDAEARTRIETLAEANAAFLRQASLPQTERMAADLQRVTGFQVYFRQRGAVTPEAPPDLLAVLASIPADGVAHRRDGLECVAMPIDAAHELLLLRASGRELGDPRLLQVLAAFWLLASLTAWLAVRGLVRPLRHLAAQLPSIERPGPIDLPEATRRDELGDLARSFVRTRQALHDEREQRARAEQLAVLGRMTAALAHEIQNPVAAIRMHAQLLREGPAEASAGVIEHEVARIEDLLNQWMFLGRPAPPVLRDVDVEDLLRRVVGSARAQFDHARVRVDLQTAGPLLAPADGRRLRQVFTNLATNAVQAMPSGGTLSIRGRATAEAIEVDFADEGRGFSTSALAHLGEFFYSEREGGMGIGLSVANEIVKAHGGSLRAANQPGGGAVVRISLPRAAAHAAGTDPSHSSGELRP